MHNTVRRLLTGALVLTGCAALAVGNVLPEFPAVLGFNQVGMVPMLPVAEIAGAAVKVNGATITVSLGQHTFSYTTEKTDATMDGAKITLPAAPFTYAGVSYVPLRALVTSLGGTLAPGADPISLDVTLPGLPVQHAQMINQSGKPQELQKNNFELFLLNTDGTPAQQLTYGMANIAFAQFSSDGSSLLFNRDIDIYQRALDTPVSVNLTSNFSKMHIMSGYPTPPGKDGTFWFMQMGAQQQSAPDAIPDICQMKTDGSGYKKMASGGIPQFSADGKIVAYMTADKDQKLSVHLMNTDGSNDHSVSAGQLQALSPDGTEVVYEQPPTQPGQVTTLAAVNAATGKEIFATLKDAKLSEECPVFSPDGKSLVYLQDNGGLWLMNADRSNPRQLEKNPQDGPAKFSPDGSKLAFTREGSLYLMNADGSHLTPLAPGLLVRDFCFSPDGSRLVATGMTMLAMVAAQAQQHAAEPAPSIKHDTRGHHTPPTPAEVHAAKVAGTRQAVITTDKGVIIVALNGADAPLTVANFVKLAKAQFYNGLTFHRVEAGFVIQGGDPDGNGMGGPGYSIKLEIANSLKHIEGALAMARSEDPDSAGSQFYITLAPTPDLDGHYAVFGKVIKGMDVVKKIEKGDKILRITIKNK